MCRGLSIEEAASYLLPTDALTAFRYLNSSGCTSIPGTDDSAEFQEVRQAMEAVGISHEEQKGVSHCQSQILQQMLLNQSWISILAATLNRF